MDLTVTDVDVDHVYKFCQQTCWLSHMDSEKQMDCPVVIK